MIRYIILLIIGIILLSAFRKRTEGLDVVRVEPKLIQQSSGDITDAKNVSVFNSVNVTKDVEVFGNVTLNQTDQLVDKMNLCFRGGGCIDKKYIDHVKEYLYRLKMKHHIYSPLEDDYIVYHDIIEAMNQGVISKHGNSTLYNDTAWRNGWKDRNMIRFGGKHEDDAGAVTTVPAGYSVVWIRVPYGLLDNSSYWTCVEVVILDNTGKTLKYMNLYADGLNSYYAYTPSGGTSDSYYSGHKWIPIPVGTNKGTIVGIIPKMHNTANFYISGLGFSKNPWNHAKNGAVAYHWSINGGINASESTDGRIGGAINDNHPHIWLGYMKPNTTHEFMVPVVPSGNDKLVYMVIYQRDDLNSMPHFGVHVNGVEIERFKESYKNPFARKFNSRGYLKYIAAFVPKTLIKEEDELLKLTVDTRRSNYHISFAEVGTHDYAVE